MNADNDRFKGSLEKINTSQRADKFRRFISEFQSEYETTLNNAQEWLKAELPIVANNVDLKPIRDELRSDKISPRRRHLLSALIFDQAVRNAVSTQSPATAALMSMYMLDHIWKAKLELGHNAIEVSQTESSASISKSSNTSIKKLNAEESRREQILTSLIQKGEERVNNKSANKSQTAKQKPKPKKQKTFPVKESKNTWKEAKDSHTKKKKISAIESLRRKSSKLDKSVLSKVVNKLPASLAANRKKKLLNEKFKKQETTPKIDKEIDDSLLDNPNNSSIMVNPGFMDNLSDSTIRSKPNPAKDTQAEDSAIMVRKVNNKLADKDHKPGNNTIIMKLATASSSGRGNKSSRNDDIHLSVPERCQKAVNELSKEYPGYDLVAIRNLAAKKVGVSAQYIENLNIAPVETKKNIRHR